MEKNIPNENNGSPKYWMSLDQWRNDSEFHALAEKEFAMNPMSEVEKQDGGVARREFLKIMGASIALTSFGCVRRPAQKIIPYAKRPEEMVLGKTNYYASSFVDGNEGFGIVVGTREGRPIKVDGNESHPSNQGGMTARAHSHVLSLYDPDRLNGPRKNLINTKTYNKDTVNVTWEDADKEVISALKGGKSALLMGPQFSPSTAALVKEFAAAYGVKIYTWSPLNLGSEIEGHKACYGSSQLPRPRFDKASYIVAIDSDFLGSYLSPAEANRGFAKGRKPGNEMNKLVAFESLLSLTGGNADERYRIRPSQQLDVVMGLLHELIIKKKVSRYAGDSAVVNALSGYETAALDLGINAEAFTKVATDLWDNRGKALVIAGGITTETTDKGALQIAVNLLNNVLNAQGNTLDYSRGLAGASDSKNELTDLVSDIDSGKVKTLLIHGVNPVYASAAYLKLKEKIANVETTVYFGDRNDETGRYCRFVLPDHHVMENWGDAEIHEGVYSIQQPTIRPLYDTRAFQDSLMTWMIEGKKSSSSVSSAETWHNYLKNYWKSNVRPKVKNSQSSFDEFWIYVLQEGVVETNSTGSATPASFRTSAMAAAAKKETPKADIELALYANTGLRDGSLANTAWLQEFPDPVTKICWDNYLCVSPKFAEMKHLKSGQMVQLTIGDQTIKVPVHIQAGTHDNVVGLAVGYGHTEAGAVANGVGVNAYRLAANVGGQTILSGLFAQIEVTKEKYDLACPQGHHSMEGRQIVVEATLKDYLGNEEAGIHRHKVFSAWDSHKYTGHKWGMTVDLNSCTGCGSCIIACQSENNIPTVGKKYVITGREMHWMRVDRYFTGTPDEPGMVNMPVMCQHCDNAPCETVCPVAATTHSEEGTNDMIYNRCVGTRYCANNCPYKVRRFNWFDYTNIKSPLNLALNPEVTVRERGVMEKCTFCVHKIKGAKNQARIEKRELKDGDVKTACQTSCPTQAIVFGDMNNPESQVSLSLQEKRNYTLLEELNNVPAVQYKTRIRNTESIKSHGGKDTHGGSSKGGH